MNKGKAVSMTILALKIVGVAGAFAALLVCPGMAQVLTMFEPKKYQRRYYPCQVAGAINRLRANSSIEIVHRNGVPCYALTEKGAATLSKHELKQAAIKKQKRWDKKWRIVIFDVRETRRFCRDSIRASLKNLGFKYLQDSVWLYPYPCSDIIELARTAYGVRHDAKYLVCERFFGDEKYICTFGLPNNRS